MKRIALAATVALALALAFAPQIAVTQSQSKATPIPAACTAAAFKPFSAAAWRPEAWKRGQPPTKVIQAQRRRLRCAPGPHRAAMQRTWRRDKAAFYMERRAMLFRERVTPFYCPGTGQWWATECTIPLHESGYGSGGGNLYGMLDAWALHGCTAFAPTAWDATKRQQDICAHRHWVDYGRGGWPPY